MAVALEIRKRFAQIVLPVMGLGALAYLGYHLFEGDRGLKASWSVEQRLAKAEAERKALMAERQKIESQILDEAESLINQQFKFFRVL